MFRNTWNLGILLLAAMCQACKIFQNGGGLNAVLNKRSISEVPICLILNDRFMFSTQVQFDVYSRVVIPGSFAAVTAPQACAVPNSIWFPSPLSCAWEQGTYGDGLGFGAPTNFYVSVQGVSSNYRKRYAYVTPSGPSSSSDAIVSVTHVFPIVTLVISVENGIVKEVFWDDDCYFNSNRKPGTSTEAESMDCAFNAYQLDNQFTNMRNQTFNGVLNPMPGTNTGFDTMVTVSACKNNLLKKDPGDASSTDTEVALPNGFCDLGIYVTWVGTSADGQQLGSANPRFKRFRDYAMLSQYPTMINFQGHSLPESI